MPDRMLVRVGYHQKDGLKVVNEKTLVSLVCLLAANADSFSAVIPLNALIPLRSTSLSIGKDSSSCTRTT